MTPQDIKETRISDLYNIDHCTHVQKPMIVTKGNNSYNWPLALTFLAHLSRRLIGELIVYRSSRRPSVRECVRPSVRPLTLSNMNISATSWPIGMKFYRCRGKASVGFDPDRIRTLVSMATDSSHRVIMGKTASPRFPECF